MSPGALNGSSVLNDAVFLTLYKASGFLPKSPSYFDCINVSGATSIFLGRFALFSVPIVYNNTDIPNSKQRSDVLKANHGHTATCWTSEKTL